MKLKKLTMHNFGEYEDHEVQMKNVMFMFGPNGTGKSTFLNALNYALDGDFEAGMMRKGCSEMSVILEMDDGFLIERRRKGTVSSSRMGYGKTQACTKEACTAEIVKKCGSNMESIRVIASSKELFGMSPDGLAAFIMRHIPTKMNREDVLSFIPDLSPAMKTEINQVLPDGFFDLDEISKAFKTFNEKRKDLARTVRNESQMVASFDFGMTCRKPEDVQFDLSEILKKIGALAERKKAIQEYRRQVQNRQAVLDKLKVLKEAGEKIKVKKPDEEMKKNLDIQIQDARKRMMNISQSISAVSTSLKSVEKVIDALKKGLCPQVIGTKCPKDWSSKLAELATEKERLQKSRKELEDSLERDKQELAEAEAKLQAYRVNLENWNKRYNLLTQYNTLKSSLHELPPKPVEIENDFEKEKGELECELQLSIRYKQMVELKKSLPEKEATVKLYEALSNAFSEKGVVIEKNLERYLEFFEKQINEKALHLGYELKLKSQNGLHVLIAQNGKLPVEISECSKGEKTVAIFLILNMLNSLTGIRMIFLDDIEALDNETWVKLLNLLNEYRKDFDHIIFAGVGHTDTLEAVKETFHFEKKCTR